MSKMVQRIVALVVMVAVSVGGTLWGINSTTIHYKNIQSDAPVVMTVNGEEVRADEYAGMLYNYMLYYEQMYAQFGMTDIWSDEEIGSAMLEVVREAAYNQVVSTYVVMQHFNDLGLQLGYTEARELAQQLSDTIDSVGGEEIYTQLLADMGFTPDTYSNMTYSSACYRALDTYYYGENGVNLPTDDELLAEFEATYPDAVAAEHILISLTDPTTGETRTEDEAKALAQEALDRVNAGESFEDVMNEVSEDPGLESYPNGYVFVEGQMLEPFYEAAIALQEGEVSGLVETTAGYHIIKRIPLDYVAQLEYYRDELTASMGATMDNLLQEWMDEADVQTTEVYDEITNENVRDYLPAEVQAILDEEDAVEQAAQDAADTADTGTDAADDAAAETTDTADAADGTAGAADTTDTADAAAETAQ